MRPKVVVVLVVVVLAALVGAVAMSGRRGTTTTAPVDRKGFPAGLADRLGGTGRVDADDIEIRCEVVDGVITFSGSCEIAIAGSDERLRLLPLRAVSALTVIAPAPEAEEDYLIEDEVDAGQDVTLAIGAGRTVVTLGCGLGASCAATIES